MTKHFAKLVVGGVYIYKGIKFERGVELPVTAEDAKYLADRFDNKIVDQGDKLALVKVPLFKVREEAPTLEEKVKEEIKDAPDTLKPKKPKEADQAAPK